MVNFFIDRPIFAWVIAIGIMMAGGLAIQFLPVQRYPTVSPPSIQIMANYPGASAKVVSNTVTQVIEQQMVGLDNLLYMSSTSDSAGHVRITLTFANGTNPDIAQVQVQNKLQRAKPLLPQAVMQQGVQVVQSSQSFMMIMIATSTNKDFSRADLADFIASELQDRIGRVEGVGSTQLFGSPHAMRIWLQPHKLRKYNLTPSDVRQAIEVQNSQVVAGDLGALPATKHHQLNASVIARTRLETTEQFRNILLKVQESGARVTLSDVARVEKGAQGYSVKSYYNGERAAGLGISPAPGANALDTTQRIHDLVAQLEPYFPEGVEVRFPFQTAPFVEVAIDEVYKTLVEAIVLVFLVMLLFLQNWRATLIPTIAVPVVLLGTLGVLAVAGFSINMLTMFGMVLAIGLLVDDAIVVVENVERVMHEDGLDPREATRRSMRQITGALIGIGIVLAAVFIPMAFFPGSTGAIYRQFSLTIATAMGLSVLVALIFTPALCAMLLKPPRDEDRGTLKKLFGWFNRGLDRSTTRYQSSIHHIGRNMWVYGVIYLIIVAGMSGLFMRLPSAFLPKADQGVLLTMVTLPSGATFERTKDTMEKVRAYYQTQDMVAGVVSIVGFGFAGRGQNIGLMFVDLEPWAQRNDETESVEALIKRTRRAFADIKDGQAFAFNLPSVPGLGSASGFDLMLQDFGGVGYKKLADARQKLIRMARKSPILTSVRANGQQGQAKYKIEVDHKKAKAMGVSMASISQMLSIAWGSSYVNDFISGGRIKRVIIQSDAEYRMLPKDFNEWYLRNKDGEMVPFSALAEGHWEFGLPRLERYNSVPAMEILGEPAPGYSTGEAMAEMERLVDKLDPAFGSSWTGLSYQQAQAGNQAMFLYAISLIVVFLALAALYESWSIPLSVILVVPLGVLGAVLAMWMRDLTANVFFQVGVLTTAGLVAKNGILIVEFAKMLQDQGHSLMNAVVEAGRVRLRPILMTSMAFTLGVTPLAFSSGPGAAARVAIGTAVLGGMVAATFLVIFFIPMFYLMVRRLMGDERREKATED